MALGGGRDVTLSTRYSQSRYWRRGSLVSAKNGGVALSTEADTALDEAARNTVELGLGWYLLVVVGIVRAGS